MFDDPKQPWNEYGRMNEEILESELDFVKAYVPDFNDYHEAHRLAELLDFNASFILLQSLMEGKVS